jgi:hypothetical protein
VAPLTDSLTIDTNKIIGNYAGIYSMAFDGKNIFIGLSDYSAPDQVVILDTLGNEINTLNVGVCPGSFAFYQQPNAEIFTDEKNGILSDFLLMTNYPNPFNSNTIIPFYLKNTNLVQLTIYNLKGELIAKLTDDYFTSGYHSVTWNGCDQSGQLSPTGIYFAEIRVQGRTQTRKMLCIK